jgi:hypothetical protein
MLILLSYKNYNSRVALAVCSARARPHLTGRTNVLSQSLRPGFQMPPPPPGLRGLSRFGASAPDDALRCRATTTQRATYVAAGAPRPRAPTGSWENCASATDYTSVLVVS